MLQQILWVSSLIIFYSFNLGCAGGLWQDVSIASYPSSAEVMITPDDTKVSTPATVSLNRKKNYTLTFKKTGYKDNSTSIISRRSADEAFNLCLCGGLMGYLNSSRGYELHPINVFVQLQKEKIDSIESPDQVPSSEVEP